MTIRTMVAALALAFPAAAALAQDEEGFQSLSLRVSATRPAAQVVVDRGSNSGLEPGDRVLFHPVGGGIHEGTVVDVGERSSVVELFDPTVSLAPSTKGEVLIPLGRLAAPSGRTGEGAAPEHPPWQADDWQPGMPLLGKLEAVRPEARSPLLTGRVYAIGDGTWASGDAPSSSFWRLGTDVEYENPFGRGGALHFDAEVNYRTLDVPEGDDRESELRLDRFSYRVGGTRFEQRRWEAGRFLQHGFPELGLLDGVEVEQRLDGGGRAGASIGFVPGPAPELETADDLQVAGYYRWLFDERERTMLGAAFQRTWYDGKTDRNLFVGKFHHLPLVGWNFHATAWVDLYTSSTDAGSGPELTQAYATAGHRWDTGNGVEVTYRHLEFPEVLRDEYPSTLQTQFEEYRNDRVSASGWRWLSGRQRVHGRVGVWDDEDDSGGDASVGMDFQDLFVDESRTDLTLFTASGEFSNVLGSRLSFDKTAWNGFWSVFYEYAAHDQEGFESDVDDIVQHRLRGSREFRTSGGWDVSVHLQTLLWDEDEDSWSFGFYIQKSF